MDLIIRNATILPMTAPGYHYQGDIAIKGGQIVALGKLEQGASATEELDASSMVAMPGLINAHTHLSMVLFRNYQDSVRNLHDWLSKIWPLEDRLTQEDVQAGSLLGIAEAIRSGTTTFADMYFFAPQTAEMVLATGIKANLGLTLFGDYKVSAERVATNLAPLLAARDASKGLIHIDVAPHAVYTCEAKTYHYAVELAQEHQLLLHSHASESREEVTNSLASFNKTPLALLAEYEFLTPQSYLAHCVHPVEEDFAIVAQSGASVIHNPSSNCKLASGIAPISRFLAEGVNVGLGTDGAASNNCLDMFKEMRLAAMLSAVNSGNPIDLTPYQILEMATIGGARALGRATECGTLEVGKDADIILINLDALHLTPLNDLFSALIFAADSGDVDTTICKGHLLMHKKNLMTLDEERAKAHVNSRWSYLINSDEE